MLIHLPQTLELVIDDLLYISYPTPCHTVHASTPAPSVSYQPTTSVQDPLATQSSGNSTENSSTLMSGAESSGNAGSGSISSSGVVLGQEEEITMFSIVVATVRPSSLSRELIAHNLLPPNSCTVSPPHFYAHTSRRERDSPGHDPVAVLLGLRNNESLSPYILSVEMISRSSTQQCPRIANYMFLNTALCQGG